MSLMLTFIRMLENYIRIEGPALTVTIHHFWFKWGIFNEHLKSSVTELVPQPTPDSHRLGASLPIVMSRALTVLVLVWIWQKIQTQNTLELFTAAPWNTHEILREKNGIHSAFSKFSAETTTDESEMGWNDFSQADKESFCSIFFYRVMWTWLFCDLTFCKKMPFWWLQKILKAKHVLKESLSPAAFCHNDFSWAHLETRNCFWSNLENASVHIQSLTLGYYHTKVLTQYL